MSRLFIFLLGVLVGATGIYYLIHDDVGRANREADGQAPTTEIVEAADDPSSGIELPPLPSAPQPGELSTQPVTVDPVPPPPVATEPQNAPVAVPPIKGLLVPVLGINTAQLSDTYTQSRGGGRSHDAIDIMAPRGTPVVAVDEGKVVKLFTSKQGGLTVYQFDRDEKVAYYYAHLDSYAPGVLEGKQLKRGELVGYVGSTGNANPAGPHLHFAVFVLGPEKSWWKGTAVNPYPMLGGRAVAAPAQGNAPNASANGN